jgi:hypothetical protein
MGWAATDLRRPPYSRRLRTARHRRSMHPRHLHAPPEQSTACSHPCAQQRQCRACIAPLAWARHCMLGNRMVDLATVNAVKGYRTVSQQREGANVLAGGCNCRGTVSDGRVRRSGAERKPAHLMAALRSPVGGQAAFVRYALGISSFLEYSRSVLKSRAARLSCMRRSAGDAVAGAADGPTLLTSGCANCCDSNSNSDRRCRRWF